MQAWWRLLRGLWPYKWSVLLSIICALGVGVSYASGVATMLPVMKIFISTEGIHGWANRLAAQEALHTQLFDLGSLVRGQQNQAVKAARKNRLVAGSVSHVALTVRANTVRPAVGLPTLHVGDRIVRVGAATNWQDMVRSIAMDARSHVRNAVPMAVAFGRTGQPRVYSVHVHALPWYTAAFVTAVDLLPADPTISLGWVVLVFIALCIIGSIFRYYQQFLGMSIAARVVMDLRRRAYDRVIALPTSYFARHGTSDVTSRLTRDSDTLTDGVTTVLGKTIQEPVKAVLSAVVAFAINWYLCLIILIGVPVIAIIIRKFAKRLRRAAHGALEGWSRMLGIIEESLVGMRVVKAYSAEGYERRRFSRVNKELLRQQTRIFHYSALSRPTVETVAVIFAAVPMLFAAHLVFQGKIDQAAFITLLACFAAMMEPLRKLSDVNSKIQQSNAAATRLFEVIDLAAEPNSSNALPSLPRHERSIEFRDITFHYPGHSDQVLSHVGFTVKHGQTAAVVGANGSGKTTLLALLPRLYVPTCGTIVIDGVDAATVSLRSLRKQIGLVSQDTVLFADTIYNNIAYGTRHATKEQVLSASRRGYADEFIRGLPEGYDTLVGEHGVRLSGGQKQRIAIARAILHDPAILILDEAMSQIDTDSEMKISLALREFTRNRTTFVIAHRFGTVVSADIIVCLAAGHVVGVGTHAQLQENCADYRKLYETQFREVG